MIDIRSRQFASIAAVAQGHNAIGDLFDLGKPMGNVDDAHARRPQVFDGRKQAVSFRKRQRTGRLVHDDEPRVLRERPGDLDHLLLRQRKFVQAGFWRDVQAEAAQERHALRAHPAAIDQPQGAAPEPFAAHEDVGGHVQIIQDVEFLVDETDAQPERIGRAANGHRITVEYDLPLIGLVDTADGFHQRGFARAVFSDERDHLARAHLQAHLPKCHDAREAFGNPLQFEQWRAHGHGRCLAATQLLEARGEFLHLVPGDRQRRDDDLLVGGNH